MLEKKFQTQQNSILYIIVLAAMAAIAAPFPILTPLVLQSHNNTLFGYPLANSLLLGIVLFIYPLGQILGGILFGKLAEFAPTKTVLVISFAASFVNNIISIIIILKSMLPMLLFTRFLSGILQANLVPILSHISKQDNRIKLGLFGKINSAINSGFLLGILLGGISIRPEVPFCIASLLILICLAIVFITFDSTDHAKISKTLFFPSISPTKYSKPLLALLFIYMIFYAGVDGFYQYFPLFILTTLGLSVHAITGYILIIGISSMICSAYIDSFTGYAKNSKLLVISLLILSFALALMYWIHLLFFNILFASIIGVAIGITTPLLMTVISDQVQQHHGLLMGSLVSLRRISDAVITLIVAFMIMSDQGIPILISSVCIAVCLILLSVLYLQNNLFLATVQEK